METYLDVDEIVNSATNFKDLFQKYCQREFKCTPDYEMTTNDPKKNEIGVTVSVQGKVYGSGSGTTRKKAEQLAAKEALTSVGVAVSA
jgi:ribonuclease-3